MKSKLETRINQKRQIEIAVSRLFLAQQTIEKAKVAYAEADAMLEVILKANITAPRIIKTKTGIYELNIEDKFAEKNTAWKSVAARRFEASFRRIK